MITRSLALFTQLTQVKMTIRPGLRTNRASVPLRPLNLFVIGSTWSPSQGGGVGQQADLVSEISDLTGVILVCWEHKHIVSDILPQIAKDQTLPGLPSKWDGQRFDVVLRFDRVAAGAPWSFRQLFPQLLAGDSNVALGG